jgi:hypothetical protein
VAPSWLAVLAGSSGLMDDAMRWASRAVSEHDPLVLWGRRFPFWDSLRADPRYAEVMRTVLAD